MKKILFISAFPPNRKTAGQNYSRQLLDDLTNSFKVDLIAFDYIDHQIELDDRVNILNIIRKRRPSFFSYLFAPILFPLFTKRFDLSALRMINRIADNYDYIYFDFSQVFIFSLFVRHPKKILMSHDVIYQKYCRKTSLFWNFLRPVIKRTEKLLLKSGYRIFCFSKKDQELIRSSYQLLSIPVSFYIDPMIFNNEISSMEIKDYFVFYGAWNRSENSIGLKWFFSNVYFQMDKKPQIKIIGGGLSQSLKDLIKGCDTVEYVGFVEDPYLLISQSQGLIAPLFDGAGVKVKVIEALATGTPIIGTHVAFEGISPLVINGIDMMILAETPDDYVEAIRRKKTISGIDKECFKSYFIDLYSKNKFVDIVNTI